MTRILVLASYAPSLRNFRGALIEALRRRGCEVHAAAPELLSDEATRSWLDERGVMCHSVRMARSGLNPLSDLALVLRLVWLMRSIRPEIFFGYTIKPVVWGLVAARIAKVPERIALITGLGYVFTGNPDGLRGILRPVLRSLYRIALRYATLIFFQNPDDREEFIRLRLMRPSVSIRLVAGSGVDTAHFSVRHFPPNPTRFIMIARLLGDKGIREYAAAAAHLQKKRPDAEFHLVGPRDSNPDGIDVAVVREWQDAGHLIWHGALADVRPALSDCHVYVLPSYREGTPRTVLEAMAIGRPVITTDAPGCRETVINGENGFLVPVRDSEALAKAMQRFLDDPSLIPEMGQRSREIAVEKYDVHKVNAAMLEAMGL